MLTRILSVFLLLGLLTVEQAQAQHYSAAPSAAQLQDAPVLLVDIRQPHEWQETGVMPNALLLPFDNPTRFLAELRPHLQPGQAVALICRTGSRTDRAARILAEQLDVPVIDIQGGMFRLLREGLQAQAPTRDQGCNIC